MPRTTGTEAISLEAASEACDIACLLFTETEWERVVARLKLSPREADVAWGLLNDVKECVIASQLGIQPRTVHAHVGHIYPKMGVQSRTAFVVRLIYERDLLRAGRCPLCRRGPNGLQQIAYDK